MRRVRKKCWGGSQWGSGVGLGKPLRPEQCVWGTTYSTLLNSADLHTSTTLATPTRLNQSAEDALPRGRADRKHDHELARAQLAGQIVLRNASVCRRVGAGGRAVLCWPARSVEMLRPWWGSRCTRAGRRRVYEAFASAAACRVCLSRPFWLLVRLAAQAKTSFPAHAARQTFWRRWDETGWPAARGSRASAGI